MPEKEQELNLIVGVEKDESVEEGEEEVEEDEDDEVVVDELEDGAPPVAHKGKEASHPVGGVLVLVPVPATLHHSHW